MLEKYLKRKGNYMAETAERHPLVSFVLCQFGAAVLLIGGVAAFACVGAVPAYFLTQIL